MAKQQDEIKTSILHMLDGMTARSAPYRHWLPSDILPADVMAELQNLEFPLIDLDGVSGTREVHNAGRHYFDVDNRANFPVVDAVAGAFQDPEVTAAFARYFEIDLDGSYLRMEYAQDTDGFWLQPHTDIGVKLFTMLLYLSDGPGHDALGTTIFASPEESMGPTPFAPNLALIFIPADNTWHGFEARPIKGVRKSLIINYVTDAWRDREQLCYPDRPIRQAA